MRRLLPVIFFLSIFVAFVPIGEVYAAPSFPIKISSDRRHLVGQNNEPFLMIGDAAWSLFVQLSTSDLDLYLSNRQQKGFNTALVNLIEHKFTSNPPKNFYGDAPFTGKVFTTPNEAYFSRVDSAINSAKQKGIVILLDALYLGYNCGDDGWCAEVGGATTADLQSWGTYVGNRYKNFQNIIWVVGGDTDPSPVKSKVNAFATALANADPNHLITAHNQPETMAISPWSGANWLTLNSTYSYDNNTYLWQKTAYNVTPSMPFFFMESAYENEHSSTNQERRAQTYWTVLSGGNGHIFGNCPIWHLSGVSSYVNCDSQGENWKNWLDRQGSLNMKYAGQLFNSVVWADLEPDFNHELVTNGYGTSGSTNFVTSAKSSDGTMAMSYLPVRGTVTVNMAKLAGPASGRWFDPSNGIFTDIAGAPFANAGSKQFSPPLGNHSDGSSDYVLVLETNGTTPTVVPTVTTVATPTEKMVGNGEVNGISPTNYLDIREILANWLKSVGLNPGAGLDQFGDGKVNAFDFAVVVRKLLGSVVPTPPPTFPAGQGPYGGVPWSIPGTIQAEDYDLGGEGVGYHDLSSSNQGGQYRSDGVDIETTGDGAGSPYHVTFANMGEWMKYTVNVKQTGDYQFYLRTQQWGSAAGGKYHLEVDGQSVTGSLSMEMGKWYGFYTNGVTPSSSDPTIPLIHLTAGQHVIKLTVDSNGNQYAGNFNWMHFKLVNPPPVKIPVSVAGVGSQVYYVSPSGNDGNPGTINSPWKTISKAADTLTAGQSVYIRAGTYKERVIPKNSGTNGNYIVYSAYPGETVTVDGSGLVFPKLNGLVTIANKEFIRVTGLRLVNSGMGVVNGAGNAGVVVMSSNHIVIDHNFISQISSLGVSVEVFSHDVLVDNNEIVNTNLGSTDDEVALGSFWYSHDIEMSNNKVHGGNNEGIGSAAGTHDVKIHNNEVYDQGVANSRIGIYIDAWTEHEYNIEVYNNIVHDVQCGGIAASSEGEGLLENVSIFNNLVYKNAICGNTGGVALVTWSTIGGAKHPLKNINIVNNTIYANYFTGLFMNNPDATNVTVRNNIINSNQGSDFKTSGVSYTLEASNMTTTNPKFVNGGAYNFHLQSDSPAINAGVATGAPSFDFDNKPRPNTSGGISIGAFEYP